MNDDQLKLQHGGADEVLLTLTDWAHRDFTNRGDTLNVLTGLLTSTAKDQALAEACREEALDTPDKIEEAADAAGLIEDLCVSVGHANYPHRAVDEVLKFLEVLKDEYSIELDEFNHEKALKQLKETVTKRSTTKPRKSK